MESLDILILLVIGLYLAGSVLMVIGIAMNSDRLQTVALFSAIAGFALQSVTLYQIYDHFKTFALTSGAFYFNLIGWALILIFLFVWLRMKSKFLGVIALPLALILVAASLATGTIRVTIPPNLTGLFFMVHIASLTLTLALLAMAFGAGIVFLRQNRRIKNKSLMTGQGVGLPSLSKSDTINHWSIVVGFCLYTLGLFSSFLWYWVEPQKKFVWDIMNISAIAVWILFAVVFYQRLVLGWKGRKPAVLAIWLFLLMVMSLLHHTITFNRNI